MSYKFFITFFLQNYASIENKNAYFVKIDYSNQKLVILLKIKKYY